MSGVRISRRGFLKVTGTLALGFHLPARSQAGPAEINAWVLVQPNDQVIIRYARSEMGQGSMTSAAQLLAEELGCDWKKVRVEYVDTNAQVPNRQRLRGGLTLTSEPRTRRPVGSLPPSKPPPARHRPGARSARWWRFPFIVLQAE